MGEPGAAYVGTYPTDLIRYMASGKGGSDAKTEIMEYFNAWARSEASETESEEVRQYFAGCARREQEAREELARGRVVARAHEPEREDIRRYVDWHRLWALLAVMPVVLLGGIRKGAALRQQATRVQARARAFSKGHWDEWLVRMTAERSMNGGGNGAESDGGVGRAKQLAAIGALSRGSEALQSSADGVQLVSGLGSTTAQLALKKGGHSLQGRTTACRCALALGRRGRRREQPALKNGGHSIDVLISYHDADQGADSSKGCLLQQ